MRKIRQFFVLFLLTNMILIFNNSVMASPADDLNQLLKSFSTYQADFTEETLSENGQVVQQSHGNMKIKRPGKFRWESNQPTQQILITDGKTLWIYDVDLAQATKQSLSSRTSIDPALLLSGAVKNLTDFFRLFKRSSDGNVIFILFPKKENLGFKQIKLIFNKNQLIQMTIVNNLSQTSEFNFIHIKLNQSLPDSLFDFKPPAGVDIISQ